MAGLIDEIVGFEDEAIFKPMSFLRLFYQPPFYTFFGLRKFHTNFNNFSVVSSVWN